MVLEHYVWLRFAHLLVFAIWLAGAIGALCLWRAGRVGTAPEAREWLRGWQRAAYLWQRYCLVLMLPVGYLLALQIGVATLPTLFIGLLVGIGALWIGLIALSSREAPSARGHRLRKIEQGWCAILAAGLLWDAYQGFTRTGHLYADWLALKFALLAVLVGGTLVLRERPMAYAALSAPLLLAAAYLGIAKIEF